MAPAVIYLSHIPDGFYEPDMKKYFGQFGHVLAVRLDRSHKSAKSKGYGYVKFADKDVAKIAASSMNNYLMFNKLLKCRVMDPSVVPKDLFARSHEIFTPSRQPQINASRQNSKKTPAKRAKLQKRMLKHLSKKNERLAQLGIAYSFNLDGCSSSTANRSLNDTAKSQLKAEIKKEEEHDLEMSALTASTSIVDPSLYSMLVDSSEDEIEFRTPPQAIRRRKSERLSKS